MRLLHDRIIVLITLVALFVAGAIPFAHGQGFESALEGFAADSYSDTDTAISAVAASGDVMAASVIEALQDARPAQWSKLIFNASVNGVSALTGLPHSPHFADESQFPGLGHLLQMGRDLNDISLVAAVMVVIMALGWFVDRFVFSSLEERIRARRGMIA